MIRMVPQQKKELSVTPCPSPTYARTNLERSSTSARREGARSEVSSYTVLETQGMGWGVCLPHAHLDTSPIASSAACECGSPRSSRRTGWRNRRPEGCSRSTRSPTATLANGDPMKGPHLVRTPVSLHRRGALQSWQKYFCQSIRIRQKAYTAVLRVHCSNSVQILVQGSGPTETGHGYNLSGGYHNPSGGTNSGAAYDECQTPILSVPHDVSVLKVVVAVHDGAAATWRPVIGRHGRLELRDFLPDFPEVEGCGHI